MVMSVLRKPSVYEIRQASGHWRVQIPLYLFPHALLFLSWFFFLSAVPFFLLTRACTWGRPLGATAPESPPLGLHYFVPFRLKIAPWTDFPDFFKLLKGTQFQHRFWFAFFLKSDPFLTDFGSHFDAIFG